MELKRREFFRIAGGALVHAGVFGLVGCTGACRKESLSAGKVRHVDLHSDGGRRPAKKFELDRPYDRVRVDLEPEWLPWSGMEERGRWKGIIIHHTATEHGPASYIDVICRGKGYDGLGYDFVINNGVGQGDGVVEVGYRWKQQIHGAHCRPQGCYDNYWNEHTIGIALIGDFEQGRPSDRQYASLGRLVGFLQGRYGIRQGDVLGHKQVPGARTKCPGRQFSWYTFERYLKT